ncbi:MAG: hypothetical protein RLZZ04_3526 [Cyanobacteriota bacterium]|jgi:uncharacterized protein YdeI (YjbR/CyaY-like superfamily)
MVKPLENATKVEAKTRQDLRSWLQANHLQGKGVWLVSYKKQSKFYLPYSDIVQECLCFGWIDSLPRKLDEVRTMTYISPRKNGSNWSKVNKEYVATLQQADLLQAAGLAKIEQAQKDGSWSFLDDVEALILPDDLKNAFAVNQIAEENWTAFPPSTKRGILEWIKNAKQSKTRARRIADTVAKAAKNIRANY